MRNSPSLYSVEVTVSFSPTTYTVMEGGSVTVTLQADIAAQVEYTIDVMLNSGGQYNLLYHVQILYMQSACVCCQGSVYV